MTESSPTSRPVNRPMNRPAPEPQDDRADDSLDDSLDEALRRARRDAAQRADAASGRRVGDRERLLHLLAAIQPILRRIPRDAELFDIGVTHGFVRDGAPGRPRLFLDMIGAVECTPGGGFRLAQTTRHGRVDLGEASDVAGASRLVADYVARRIVERESALAGDRTVEDAALRLVARERDAPTAPKPVAAPALPRADAPRPAPRAPLLDDEAEDDVAPRPKPQRFAATRERFARWRMRWRARRSGALERGLIFAVQFLGAAALTLIVAMAAWWAWKTVGFVK